MRGVATSLGIEIEFEDEPVLPARRVLRGHLQKARSQGAHAVRCKITKTFLARKRK
jgi:hypothetical protein